MGPSHTPRHRAEVPRSERLANLRRDLARLLAGRDLYADDRLLRPELPQQAAAAPAPRSARLAAAAEDRWKALPSPAARSARRPRPA